MVTGFLQLRPAGLALAALVGVAACGGGIRTPVDSPLDARKVAPAERSPTSDHGDAAGLTAGPPSTDAAPLAGDAAAPSAPGGLPGTAELRLVVPAGSSYCDQQSTCDPQGHISIQDEAGRPVTVSLPYCPFICNAICAPPSCPPPAACEPTGSAFTGEQRIWDGQVHATSTCGMNTTCYQARFAPPGHYLAVMCATPGRLTGGDGGPPTCQPTGVRTCIEVPFDLPSAAPVIGHLP
jgi:hypothetical protein